MNGHFRSCFSLCCLFSFFEFLLVGSFLGNGSLIGPMCVVGLIQGHKGNVNAIVHSKSHGEDKDLPHPRVLLEDSGEESPSEFGSGVGGHCGDDLSSASWI